MFLAPFLLCASGNAAAAYVLQLADVISSYGSCNWSNNGDGTSTISLSFNYKDAAGRLGVPGAYFMSRGLLIYTYDANGKLLPSSKAANYVAINGDKTKGAFTGSNYIMYYNTFSGMDSPWRNRAAFVANVEIQINNSVIANWPAIAVRAGNYTNKDDVGEVTGAAYLSKLGSSSCTVLDPNIPPPKPPPAIVIDMAAPDWSLGELPRGEYEKTLSGVAQQLCLTYSGDTPSAIARRFVIDATSENGTSGGKFFLKNVANANQKVPYSITLDSGVDKFDVPNRIAGGITLNKGSRTCFVPTFKTSVDPTVDTGNYSDVLSFTIITKS